MYNKRKIWVGAQTKQRGKRYSYSALAYVDSIGFFFSIMYVHPYLFHICIIFALSMISVTYKVKFIGMKKKK